ncbi:hypothetical protein M426DRAFT_228086 [Hypoxylon sp. CI-4A]|nr:hypothetical protein M426DRAFT_228086 [Hypoxylon sp. CI-4A]
MLKCSALFSLTRLHHVEIYIPYSSQHLGSGHHLIPHQPLNLPLGFALLIFRVLFLSWVVCHLNHYSAKAFYSY